MFAATIERARMDALRLLRAIDDIPSGLVTLELLRASLQRVSEFSNGEVRNRFVPRQVNVALDAMAAVLDSPEMFVTIPVAGEGKAHYVRDDSGERIEIGEDFLESCSLELLVGILLEEAFHARDPDDESRGETARCYREFRAKLFQMHVLFRWLDEEANSAAAAEIEKAIRECIKEYQAWFYTYTKDE